MKKQKFSDRLTTSESSTASDESVSDELETSAKKHEPIIASGMVAYKWSGVDAWMCPDCKSSTTDKEQALSHVCQKIQYYKPEGEDQ